MSFDLLRKASRSADSLLRVGTGILADSALWQLEARIQLRDEAPPPVPTGPSLDETGGLSEAERLNLCERLVIASPEPHRHLAWVPARTCNGLARLVPFWESESTPESVS